MTEPQAIAVADIPTIVLPNWRDAGSVSSFLISAASIVVGILMMFHVAVPATTSDTVSTIAGVAGFVIAAAVQTVNQHRITKTNTAAISAGVAVKNAPPMKMFRR